MKIQCIVMLLCACFKLQAENNDLGKKVDSFLVSLEALIVKPTPLQLVTMPQEVKKLEQEHNTSLNEIADVLASRLFACTDTTESKKIAGYLSIITYTMGHEHDSVETNRVLQKLKEQTDEIQNELSSIKTISRKSSLIQSDMLKNLNLHAMISLGILGVEMSLLILLFKRK